MMRVSTVLLVALACASAGEVPLDTAFALKHGETVTVAGTDLTMTLADFEDSRCPRNVHCVWAGEAKVHLRINNSETVSVTVPGSAQSGGYVIEVRELNPYPEDPPKRGVKTATVVVSRR